MDCPNCDYGYVYYFDGGGRMEIDACYHCFGTGVVADPLTLDEVNAELQEIANESNLY